MHSKLLNKDNEKTWALILDSGDEVVESLLEFARTQNLKGTHFSAIGAFSEATVGFFDFAKKDYQKIPIPGQTEVLVLTGDIGVQDGKPGLHAHVVLGKPDGSAHGGHLLKAIVHPTLEIILTESPAWLTRKKDEETGLALIRW